MSQRVSYQYATLRCVPRVDREEFVNLGVVLYAQQADFLAAAWSLDEGRLSAFAPGLDLAQVRERLVYVDRICAGDPEIGGPGRQSLSQRFGFLKAPRSTIVQPGPVHGGVTTDPERALAELHAQLIG